MYKYSSNNLPQGRAPACSMRTHRLILNSPVISADFRPTHIETQGNSGTLSRHKRFLYRSQYRKCETRNQIVLYLGSTKSIYARDYNRSAWIRPAVTGDCKGWRRLRTPHNRRRRAVIKGHFIYIFSAFSTYMSNLRRRDKPACVPSISGLPFLRVHIKRTRSIRRAPGRAHIWLLVTTPSHLFLPLQRLIIEVDGKLTSSNTLIYGPSAVIGTPSVTGIHIG